MEIFDNLGEAFRSGADAPASCRRDRLASALAVDLVGAGIIVGPFLISTLADLLQKPGDVLPGQHMIAALHGSARSLGQAAFTLLCLPYEALFSMDAVVRTLWRLLVAKKRLLEWNPSGDSDRKSRKSLAASFRTMWICPAIAVAVTIHLAIASRTSWFSPCPCFASGLWLPGLCG